MTHIVHILFCILICHYSIRGDSTARLKILPEGTSFTKALDENFVLTCEVSGLGPQLADITLHWEDDKGNEISEIAAPGRLVYVEKESESPTKKLYFKKIQLEHAGTYACWGIIEGNKEKHVVSLQLFKAITYDYVPSPQFKTLFSNALIECRVSGNPIPTISWRYGGKKITDDSRYAQDNYGLNIHNITMADEGVYTCCAEVEADGRYKEQQVNVIIHIPPKIDRSKLYYEGVQAQMFALKCVATGLPEPRFEFTKDGNTNPLYSTSDMYFDPEAGQLTFNPLKEQHAGNYSCRASNNVGEDVAIIRFVVYVPPSIYGLLNVTAPENKSTTLICYSYGDPPPIMTFHKTGTSYNYMLGSNDNGRIVVTAPERGRLEMKIFPLSPYDMSNYTCISENKVGFDKRNGTVTVLFAPLFLPDNIRSVYIWPGKTKNMTCQTFAEPMPSFEWYIYPSIKYAIFNNQTYRIHLMGKNSNLQVTVREQDDNWIYGDYKCRAWNAYGSNELKIALLKAKLPDAPNSVVPIEVTSDLIKLKAESPKNNGGMEVIQYRVDFENRILYFGIDEFLLIEELRPSTTFLFRIRALTEVGVGDPYTLTVTTDDVKPPSKLIITSEIIGREPYRYTITWRKPITGGRPIREYEFKLRKVEFASTPSHVLPLSEWLSRIKPDDDQRPQTSYVLEQLDSATSYQLQVRARNDLGWSEPNDPFIFATDYDPFGEGIHDCASSKLSDMSFTLLFVLTMYLTISDSAI